MEITYAQQFLLIFNYKSIEALMQIFFSRTFNSNIRINNWNLLLEKYLIAAIYLSKFFHFTWEMDIILGEEKEEEKEQSFIKSIQGVSFKQNFFKLE